MLSAFLVINQQGTPRLAKFYEEKSHARQQELIRAVYAVIGRQSGSEVNFVKDERAFGPGVQVVFRAFATLIFAVLCDDSESPLGVLDVIKAYVESLDRCFKNVCELDLVFESEKAHAVLNEMVLGGLVMETNPERVTRNIAEMTKAMQKGESGPSSLLSPGGARR